MYVHVMIHKVHQKYKITTTVQKWQQVTTDVMIKCMLGAGGVMYCSKRIGARIRITKA